MKPRILFVCHGNICRSPAAEGVLRQLLPDTHSDSAGIARWHVGEAPYGPMQEAALGMGYDLSDLRARQVTARDFHEFDLIIAMDAENRSDLEAIRPTQARTPVHLLTDFAPETGADKVPDPYYTRDFSGALDLIQTGVQGLARHLHPSGFLKK